jgi:cytochrome c6
VTVRVSSVACALALAALAGAVGAADVNKGAQLYARHCAGCHGNAGVPVMPGTPNLSQPASLMRGDAALADVIRNGRMSMPGYRGILKDNEVHDVIAFLRTLLR